MNLEDMIFLVMYILIQVYLFIKMLMRSYFVCATLNLGRKKVNRNGIESVQGENIL